MISKRRFPGTDIESTVFGMGCMRLPTLEGENHPVNRQETARMIHSAVERGVTYFDTAYGYCGGESEIAVGEALKGGWREKITLTTKLPVWKVEQYEDMERLLDEQLHKLQVEYVDFYLLHALNKGSWEKVRDLGALRFLEDMRKKGKIRYPGFSFHDNFETYMDILNSFDWKLSQVQMNLLDENNQATMEGVRRAGEKGCGIVVMEPLRGGSLARTPGDVQKVYDEYPVKRSPVEWAFRYLYDRSEVITILSGVSTMEQLDDNIRIFQDVEAGCMDEGERELIRKVRETYMARMKVGCTGCEYCQPCPKGVKIPGIFRPYDNACMFDDMEGFARHYARMKEKGEDAAQCVGCGKCESMCPQHIPIREHLRAIREAY